MSTTYILPELARQRMTQAARHAQHQRRWLHYLRESRRHAIGMRG
jgi:hypothetical protein